MKGGGRVLTVEVVNASPEPDGRFKRYWLYVDPDLRPLLDDDGNMGEPQELTARAAVASTWGLRAEEYRPDVET